MGGPRPLEMGVLEEKMMWPLGDVEGHNSVVVTDMGRSGWKRVDYSKEPKTNVLYLLCILAP